MLDQMTDVTDSAVRVETAVLALLRRANDPRGFQRIHQLAGVDIERAGAVMLARIEELEPARLSDVADAAGIEISTASRQVAKLVSNGFVDRSPDPDDARAALHRLTPEGRELRHRIQAAARGFFDQAMAEFTDAERDQFADLLHRFVEQVLASAARAAED